MRILGLILTLATAALTFASIWASDPLLTTPATTIDLLGNQVDMTVGEVFAAGITAGVLATIGLITSLKRTGGNTRSRATARHQLRDDGHETHDQQQKHATAAANAEAADNDGITSRR